MILACQNINKAFGTNVILKDASFHIEEKEKAAIVGINGAGKSTLLKIIMKQIPADSGEVILAKDRTIGYLAQHEAVSSGNTIYEELLEVKQDIFELERHIRTLELQMKSQSGGELEQTLELYNRLNTEFEQKNGYACKSEIVGVLKGLGFMEDEFSKQVDTLSGGQKTRVALGKLLLAKPDLILLDEPTNHLDMQSIAWLENFLINYSGAVIIVAHDRYFLNRVVSKVIEIDHAKATTFLGNYSAYSEKKAQLRDSQLKVWMNQQREIKHQQEVIDKLKSFNREKSIKRAESREKMLEKMEVLDRPDTEVQELKLSLEPRFPSGNDVLRVEGLAKSFGDHTLFTDLDFEIKRGERVALIGNNGTGKTTILKIINELLAADAGSFTLGSKVCIGYYDQEHHVLHMEKTLFEEISDDYPTLTNTEIRNVLAAFLFTGDDVFKRISDLSGGERGRVSLAKLMLSEANFLILDEPTNHLDILSKEILEQALNRYTGTVFYVSHDRYFINQTATRILELTGNTLVNYIGNYDYYLEKKDELTKIYVPSATEEETASLPSSSAETAGKLTWQQQKEEQARIRKRQNELKKTEDRIHVLEVRDKEIDELMMQEEVFTNVAKCVELNKEKTAINEELEQLYERWEELAE
ncbi:ATP-binding cassette domain-containing protein [Ruminococcus sp. MCC718]|uniref:ABC-F family ATP-binding cassette domain-containing protein n=1 Tax=Ruminococcus sp. MCC718 TaxID=2592649 RepID=UPI001C00B073|nr:ABC-F family ATP-binding cassette domain-containing protein [Ruminococcus sp. MCC718]MBT9654050.1 ATP-binding cassette domain-containing protein [Ruminococcus sp. MCC718]